jgi:predicted Zn-dependent protease
MSRRAKLESLLAVDPDDVFLHYALATELIKEGDAMAADARFTLVHQRYPDYVAAWFRHAQWAHELGKLDEARTLATTGLEAARRVGDHHAAGELMGFLELLP